MTSNQTTTTLSATARAFLQEEHKAALSEQLGLAAHRSKLENDLAEIERVLEAVTARVDDLAADLGIDAKEATP